MQSATRVDTTHIIGQQKEAPSYTQNFASCLTDAFRKSRAGLSDVKPILPLNENRVKRLMSHQEQSCCR